MLPRVLIAGGGVAAVEAVLALRALAGDRVDVTLVADEEAFVYRPLAVGVPFDGASTVRVPLGAVAADQGFSHLRDRITGVDLDRKLLLLEDGGPSSYDHLLIALGAVQEPTVPGALTFRGPADVGRFREALGKLEDADGGHVVFVSPSVETWTMPLYELALLTSNWAAHRELDVHVSVVTPEARPLEKAGEAVSAEVAELLSQHRVEFRPGMPAGGAEGDLVVALPELVGQPLPGLPHDARGFVEVDEFCRIVGAEDAYAVGDMAAHEIKQGGLAAQQADIAAACIAAAAGVPVRPEPYRPRLRAVLFTGERPRFLGDEGLEAEPWWPPHKIVGAHLGPYLATHAELLEPLD